MPGPSSSPGLKVSQWCLRPWSAGSLRRRRAGAGLSGSERQPPLALRLPPQFQSEPCHRHPRFASSRLCWLTLRSSADPPPASRLGREALTVYDPPRGQAAFPAAVRSARTLGSAARQAHEPSVSIAPGALQSQSVERRAQRGEWDARRDIATRLAIEPLRSMSAKPAHIEPLKGQSVAPAPSKPWSAPAWPCRRRSEQQRMPCSNSCASSSAVRAAVPPPAERFATVSLPNPSLERGPSNGLARAALVVYDPPRGPSRWRSAQLKR